GVDIRLDALADARDAVMSAGTTPHLWCGDLTAYPLPASFFDLTVVVRYLQRDLFPALAAALRPGGILIYETFTTEQLALGTGPRSPDHLLRLGELRNAFGTLSVEFYEEVAGPDALARLIARAP
ncbi:MAG TPA: class I SAM-dependent methyltransferase, partial [Vicinamibacterales bacterium]|nr:class I SAM-dependent methyltransferase [Vicinamibacterales bacterium]